MVYTSGINTVNIETAQAESGGTEPVKVVINGTEYTAGENENGVITLYYDFKTDLKIGETTYKAESLCRKVMTYGKCWYYIAEDGTVHYGMAVSKNLDVPSPEPTNKFVVGSKLQTRLQSLS